MACIDPSQPTWRKECSGWSDKKCEEELVRAWGATLVKRQFPNPSVDTYQSKRYHEWTGFRAATVREARKRGLSLKAAGLGT